jgi:catechol 2,3-dioxygenase-like lactoylglutathione lyase family enzyme
MSHLPDERAGDRRAMVLSISLVVLRCRDVGATRRFYEALGLVFQTERHGSGPEHYSCRVGDTVLELYPASVGATPAVARLGFRVASVADAMRASISAGGRVDRPFDAATGTAVVIDPDGTKVEVCQPVRTDPSSADATWAVWRQDDNGNRFLISAGHTREEAERLCNEFEARGHKQLYWVSPHKDAR